jgi:hypothetical protein
VIAREETAQIIVIFKSISTSDVLLKLYVFFLFHGYNAKSITNNKSKRKNSELIKRLFKDKKICLVDNQMIRSVSLFVE